MQQKQALVKELFESCQLVKYPSEDDERSQFILVNLPDLQVIKELDDENNLSCSLVLNQPKNEKVDLDAQARSDSFEDLEHDFEILKNEEVSVKKYSSDGIIMEDYFKKETSEKIDWFQLKQFDFRKNPVLFQKMKSQMRSIAPVSHHYDELKKQTHLPKVSLMESTILHGEPDSSESQKFLSRVQMLQRQHAWCLMLGIDFNSSEFENFKNLYDECLANNKEDASDRVLNQIKLDVVRTFRTFNLKFLNSDVTQGKNRLYNLLKVYALVLEPEIGYTQGMNFIAALILMHCPTEQLACYIFMKVLNIDNWVRMYICSTPKLFDLSAKIMDKLNVESPDLHSHLFEYQIYLEMVLAGPLMTLFASNLSFSESTHILNMFMLSGENFIVDTIVNVYKNMAPKILKFSDQFEIQAYLSKEVFEEALVENKFYVE